jgi:hypothetical protein
MARLGIEGVGNLAWSIPFTFRWNATSQRTSWSFVSSSRKPYGAVSLVFVMHLIQNVSAKSWVSVIIVLLVQFCKWSVTLIICIPNYRLLLNQGHVFAQQRWWAQIIHVLTDYFHIIKYGALSSKQLLCLSHNQSYCLSHNQSINRSMIYYTGISQNEGFSMFRFRKWDSCYFIIPN